MLGRPRYGYVMETTTVTSAHTANIDFESGSVATIQGCGCQYDVYLDDCGLASIFINGGPSSAPTKIATGGPVPFAVAMAMIVNAIEADYGMGITLEVRSA